MAVSVTLGQVLTSSLAAFAFARLRFPGRDKLFLGYLATMMVPGEVTLIPVYILFVKMPELLNLLFRTEWKLISTTHNLLKLARRKCGGLWRSGKANWNRGRGRGARRS